MSAATHALSERLERLQQQAAARTPQAPACPPRAAAGADGPALPADEHAKRHYLARYLAGVSPEGAALPIAARRACYAKLKARHPAMMADIAGRIARGEIHRIAPPRQPERA